MRNCHNTKISLLKQINKKQKMNKMKKVASNSSTGNEVNELCSELDWLQLRSQTDANAEELGNRAQEMEIGDKQGEETAIDGGDGGFGDEIERARITSTVFRPGKGKNSETQLCFHSLAFQQHGQKIVIEPQQHIVQANPEHKMSRTFNQLLDMEETPSTIFRPPNPKPSPRPEADPDLNPDFTPPNNEHKIFIKGILFRDEDSVKESLDLCSNYYRKLNEIDNVVRKTIKPMDGVEIVRSRSKAKNPRPTSGNPFKSSVA